MLSKRNRRVVFAIAACVAALWPTSAGGHALLASTDPKSDQVVAESPERVSATFSERVEIAFGALRVHDTNANRVDVGDATHPDGDSESVSVSLEPDLPDGTYTVTYRVISADGHPIDGAFVFHIGRPGERAEGIAEQLLSGSGGSGGLEQVLYGIARWLNFAALIVLGGAFFFLVLIWARVARDAPNADSLDRRFAKRWRHLVVWGWTAAIVATVAGFVLQGAIAADLSVGQAFSPRIAAELLKTRYGWVAAVRLGLLLAAGVAFFVSRPRSRAEQWPLRQTSTAGAAAADPGVPRWMAVSGAALFLLLSATPGLSGHAGATAPTWLNVPADALHVAAASVWIGGLITLLTVAYRAASTEEGTGLRTLGSVIIRFSDVAMVAVGVLVVTGLYRTWVEVQAWRAFVAAPYGWVLLAKIGVFLPLLAMGAVNNRVLKPRVEQAMASPTGVESAPARTLKRVVVAEIALGVVVLGLTALLVNLPPAKVEAGVTGPFIADVALGSDNLNVLVDPNQAGENIIHLTATTPEGTPAEIQGMRVRLSMPEEDIGPLLVKGERLAPGHFAVQGRELSIPGRWVIAVEARIDKFTNTHAEVELTVNP